MAVKLDPQAEHNISLFFPALARPDKFAFAGVAIGADLSFAHFAYN